jgi:hypothetical protein
MQSEQLIGMGMEGSSCGLIYVLPQLSHGGTEENHENLIEDNWSQPLYEPGTSQIQSNVNHSAMAFAAQMLLFLQSFFAFCLLYDRLDCTIITKNHG